MNKYLPGGDDAVFKAIADAYKALTEVPERVERTTRARDAWGEQLLFVLFWAIW